jgi:putative GTP pyrophosphokinase
LGNEQVIDLNQLKEFKLELTRFMMAYKFALDEMNTKINILKDEFNYIHEYNPIEHVKSRIKSPESILKKVLRKGCGFSLGAIRKNIRDIAGIRITCSFTDDIYELYKMITNQKDIKVIDCKDYIKNPKPNGYQSLHLILEIPIFMSDHQEGVFVELQIRTIAMDFWASLEHKIFYKYGKEVPEHIITGLKDAASLAVVLDKKMERIHKEISDIKQSEKSEDLLFLLSKEKFNLQYLESLIKKDSK